VVKEVAIGGTHRGKRFPSPLLRGLSVAYHTPGVPLRSTPGSNSNTPFGRWGKTDGRGLSKTLHICEAAHPIADGRGGCEA
jgi:hypothetical protein